MRKLVERSIEALEHRMIILAPVGTGADPSFANVTTDPFRHDSLLRDVQRLRGAVYVADGALQPQQLSSDGRHETPEDERSWHLLVTDENGDVSACLWYKRHDADVSFADLRVSSTPLGTDPMWRDRVWVAVESELALAREEGRRFSEAGGWAAKKGHCPCDGLLLAMGAFSLSRKLGSPRAMTTATVRHGSANILRRLGGASFFAGDEEIAPYYDPKYQCTMELLRFDGRFPDRKYATFIEMLQHNLARVPVVSRTPIVQPTAEPVAASLFGLLNLPMLQPSYAV